MDHFSSTLGTPIYVYTTHTGTYRYFNEWSRVLGSGTVSTRRERKNFGWAKSHSIGYLTLFPPDYPPNPPFPLTWDLSLSLSVHPAWRFRSKGWKPKVEEERGKGKLEEEPTVEGRSEGKLTASIHALVVAPGCQTIVFWVQKVAPFFGLDFS